MKKILIKYKYHLVLLFLISFTGVFIEISIYKKISFYSKYQTISLSVLYYFILLFIIKYLIILFGLYIQPYIAYKMMSDISKGVLNSTLSIGRFDYPLSKVIRFTAVETEHLVMSFLLPIIVLVVEIIMQASIVWYFILMLSQYNFSIYIPILLISFIIILFYYLLKKQQNLGKKRQYNEEFRYREIKTFFEVYEEVKNFDLINHFRDRYLKRVKSVEIVARSSNFNQQLPRLIVEIFGILFLALLSFNFYKNGIDFKDILSTITILALGAIRIVPSLTRIMSSSQTISYSYKSYQLIDMILAQESTIEKNFKNYNFHISNDLIKFTSNQNSFELKDKRLNIIKGKSGSGKSTFLKELNNWLCKIESKKVTYMPQESRLFSGTLKENLFLFDDSITSNEVKKIFNVLGLDGIFYRFYDSNEIIDEEATVISGGEMRRIVLARHLLRNPNILLLDEPTSGLDTRNEIAVFDLLKNISKDIMIILVTHSDNIDNNQIIEF